MFVPSTNAHPNQVVRVECREHCGAYVDCLQAREGNEPGDTVEWRMLQDGWFETNGPVLMTPINGVPYVVTAFAGWLCPKCAQDAGLTKRCDKTAIIEELIANTREA